MAGWQVVEGHWSSGSWSLRAHVMARPHPKCSWLRSAQQKQDHWGAVSPSPWRWGDGQATAQTHTFMVNASRVSQEPSLPNSSHTQLAIAPNHPLFVLSSLMPVQAHCRTPPTNPDPTALAVLPLWGLLEQWWDVRWDLQVWAGPEKGRYAQGQPTLQLMLHYVCIQGCENIIPQMLSPLRPHQTWPLTKSGLTGSAHYPSWSALNQTNIQQYK